MKSLDEELAWEYIQCRQNMSSKADLVSYWHWLYRTHKGQYAKVAARVKEKDEDVLRVQQRLLKEGW